jgi:predicted dienelactone hydrolase
MRPIELSLTILTVISLVLHLLPNSKPKFKYLIAPAVLGLAVAAQVFLEGFRYQLWPLFAAISLFVLVSANKWRTEDFEKRPVGASAFGIILALLSLAAGWLLPVPTPYPITGPYQVGTTVFPLVDTSRTELYADSPNQPREIMVQVWYPANPAKGDRQAQWMPDVDKAGPAIAEWIELPSFSLNHLKYGKANGFVDAEVVPGEESFPLLIFSHGWSGFKEQNIYQVEELASHGYIVAAINHTYGAVLTVFPDGREMPRNDDALPDGVSEEEYTIASNRLISQWAGDISFLIDKLTERDWNLSGRIDFDKIGIFGHSTGGGAAAEFCGTDTRCQAALMMDLWVEPVSDQVIADGLSQPYLLMHSASWVNLNDPSPNFLRVGDLVAASSGEVTEFRIEGTQHHDFSSLPLLTPLASAIGLKGPIPGDTGLKLINHYSVAFFDQVLKDIDAGLLEAENAPDDAIQFVLKP